MVSRSGRRRELSSQREAVKKQECHWRESKHAYRDKERAEKNRTPALGTLLLDGRGRGNR